MDLLSSIGRRLRFWFELDLRSAALFRIAIGSVLVAQWIDRWGWLERLYTAEGAMPGALAGQLAGSFSRLSPLSLGWIDGSPLVVRACFLAALACYLLFLVGYRTRVSGLLTLLAWVAIAQRNPFLLIGADQVLGPMLVWAQLMPVGRRFSVDRWRGAVAGQEDGGTRVFSVAAFGATLQLGMLYLFAALWKQGVSWQDGTAFHYVLRMEQFVYLPGVWLREAPDVWIRVVTWGTLVLEYAALPLIFFPWGRPWPRRVAWASLVGLHLGIALTMDVGVFSIAMIASLSLLLSGEDWDALGRLRGQSTRAAGLEPPPPIRAAAGGGPGVQTLSALFLLSLVASALVENLILPRYRSTSPPAVWRFVDTGNLPVRLLAAPQRWNMFAPEPPPYDHWWVAVATGAEGRTLDPLTGDEPVFEQPSWSDGRFDSTWGNFLTRAVSNLEPGTREPTLVVRRQLCDYLAREAARAGLEPRSVEIYHLRRFTPRVDREAYYKTDRHLLGRCLPGEERFIPDDRHLLASEWYRPSPADEPVLIARGSQDAATGRRNGPWSGWDESGQQRWVGEFRDDRPTGRWTFWSEDGTVATGQREGDERRGRWTLRQPDGSYSTGTFRGSTPHGSWERFDPQGRLRVRTTLVAGKRQGPAESFFPGESAAPGPTASRGAYENDLKQGTWVYFYPDGQRKMEGRFVDDRREGSWTFWRPDGSVERRVRYVEGRESGVASSD